MFVRMLKESFSRQAGIKILAISVIALGACVFSSLLNLSLDIGDKMAGEMRQYGANILAVPKERNLPLNLAGVDFNPLHANSFMDEKCLGRLREIFWCNNIKAVAPYLKAAGKKGEKNFEIIGTWFEKKNAAAGGDEFIEGIRKTMPWLEVDGQWIDDEKDYDTALVNEAGRDALGVRPQDKIAIDIHTMDETVVTREVRIKGIVNNDEAQASRMYVPLKFLQETAGLRDKIHEIRVSAVTTPENELSKRYQEDPNSLSSEEYERWYCTAYASSIAFQIEEILPGISATPIRKIAESEGAVLKKIDILMVFLTLIALAAAALGIWSLMMQVVLARAKEIGLLKALGAETARIVLFFIAEIVVISVLGSIAGYGAGVALSWIIAKTIFGSGVSVKLIILPLAFLLSLIAAGIGSLSPIKIILKVEPAGVLHGG